MSFLYFRRLGPLKNYSVKRDLSPTERLRDAVLLKERWSLIESGTPRTSIKIRHCKLYVGGVLHCSLDSNNSFLHHDRLPDSVSTTPQSQSLDSRSSSESGQVRHSNPPFIITVEVNNAQEVDVNFSQQIPIQSNTDSIQHLTPSLPLSPSDVPTNLSHNAGHSSAGVGPGSS